MIRKNLTIAIIIVPFFTWLIVAVIEIPFIPMETSNDWIGFYATYLGSLIGFYAIYWSSNSQSKNIERLEKMKYRPIVEAITLSFPNNKVLNDFYKGLINLDSEKMFPIIGYINDSHKYEDFNATLLMSNNYNIFKFKILSEKGIFIPELFIKVSLRHNVIKFKILNLNINRNYILYFNQSLTLDDLEIQLYGKSHPYEEVFELSYKVGDSTYAKYNNKSGIDESEYHLKNLYYYK